MKKPDNEMDDELRPEYDLKSLRARKVGSMRAGFGGNFVQLAPDVAAELFASITRTNQRSNDQPPHISDD